MIWLRGFGLAALLACGAAAASPAGAQQVRTGDGVAIGVSGILSATFFLQDSRFGLGGADANGQKAENVLEELGDDAWWHGGDIRSTRLRLAFSGPEVVDGWRANAVFETDFFAMFPGSSAFSDEQPIPRLRLAFLDLTNGRTTLRFGQDWALTLGQIPTSTSHIGFPLGWGSGGFIGWRFVGAQAHHRLTASGAPVGATLKLAAFANSWSGEPASADGPSLGEAGLPQLEARLDLDGATPNGTWRAYAVGHYDRKDLSGVGAEADDDGLTSWAIEGGGQLAAGALTLQGNAYYGQSMGHHFAHIFQMPNVELTGWGAWAQAGVDVTKRWSVWGYFGMDDPDQHLEDTFDVLDRWRSWSFVPMLRFKAGPYAMGLEWLHNRTEWFAAACRPELSTGGNTCSGNQILLSGMYSF